jgi:RNA polymerase sigma factor (sigma-70 family)
VQTLYEQHARTIHRYLARRLGTDLADDLTADTFVTAIRRWPIYDQDQGPPIAWLYGIATNLARNHQRRERSELLATQRVQRQSQDQPDGADAAIARIDDARAARQLGPAIAALKPADRDVLLLLAWTELSYQEVAQALNIPIGTVRSRMHRVRHQLKIATQETESEQS